MKKFILFITLLLINFFFISNSFALMAAPDPYELNNTEKVKLDVIVQKLEVIISIKGENYRDIFISKLKEIKIKSSSEKLRSYVDYIVEKIDKIDDFDCLLDGSCLNKDCSSTTMYINGHKYSINNLKNGLSADDIITEEYYNVDNGKTKYSMSFYCKEGQIYSYSAYDSIVSKTLYCDTGYYKSDSWYNKCIKNNYSDYCENTIINIDGHLYNVPKINKNETIDITTKEYYKIDGGKSKLKQQFKCENGSILYSIQEISIDLTCDVGYKNFRDFSCNPIN